MCKIKKQKIFSNWLFFAPSNLRLVKGFFSYIQIRIFPFHRTLTTSSPARIDTRYLSVHPARLAGENAAELESRGWNGSVGENRQNAQIHSNSK